MSRNGKWEAVDPNRIAVSPWLNVPEASYYLGMKETSFRKIAPMIGGRKPPCFSRELRFYKPDLDDFMLKMPKIV